MLFAVLAFSGCNPTKRLAEGEVLLQKNKIKVVDEPSGFDISQYDMSAVLKQRPNRRVLLFRFHLGVFNRVNPERRIHHHARKEQRIQLIIEDRQQQIDQLIQEQASERKIKRKQARLKELRAAPVTTWRDWLAFTVGEKPVVIDSALTRKSADQLSVYLAKKGYFSNEVTYSLDTLRKGRRAIVNYVVHPYAPYKVKSLEYAISDPGIGRRTDFFEQQSTIQPGDVFSVEALDAERVWITDYLNNRGYYSFTKEYITFTADSSVGNREVAVTMKVRSLLEQSPFHPDSLMESPHRKYFIGDIYVHTDYSATDNNYAPTDTLEFEGLHILYSGELELSPQLIRYLVAFNSGDLYQKDYVTKTYRNFSKLQLFRSSSVRFEDIQGDELNVLTCHLLLARAKSQTLSMESTGTHRNGNLGIQGSMGYRHRNLFNGAETGEINVVVGFEAQNTITQTEATEDISETVADRARLNTFEIGPEFTLRFHKLVPFSLERISNNSDPKTTLTAAYNFQSRPDYERQLTQFRMGYDWIENIDKGSHIYWDLVKLSLIKIDKSPEFQKLLDDLGDAYLASSYQNHFITSGGVSWVLNNQKKKLQRKYFFNKASFSIAGNLMRLGYNMSKAEVNENGGYEIAGIQFAQFLKIEEDFRLYRNPDEKNTIAFRFHAGMGKPGANLGALPFEESFFAGGSNDIRAWQARSLGPGSYRDTTALVTYNSIGEFKLQSSIEYRFDITPMFEGAFFFDAGNIWLLQDDLTRSGGKFELKNLGREIAVGGGAGLRMDFDFFLVRFDFGIQLKDPAKVSGEQWFFQKKDEYINFTDTYFYPNGGNPGYRPVWNFNLGIGYPF
ncbi:MAG: BamA/TamA family outer membrane protein [Flavobacteriales bacterium]|nr:BamA/TamA family outer membrane protein [Flavobacteriales bacterium]